MNRRILSTICVSIILLSLAGCILEATQDSMAAPVESEATANTFLTKKTVQARVVDSGDPDNSAEALTAVHEKSEQLQLLWHDHLEELETVAETMLQLQREVTADSPNIIWKNPYFYTENDPPFSINLTSSVDQTEIEVLVQKLLSLSADGSFTTAFPDLSQRVADSDTCEFQIPLFDSRGEHYANISLVYCAAEYPVTVRCWTPNWLDGHWFLCTEWLE